MHVYPGAEHAVGRMLIDAGSAVIDASVSDAVDPEGGSGGAVANAGASGTASGGRGGAAGVLVDAGQLLVDAGNALLDASEHASPDAAAEEPSNSSGTRIELRQITQTGSDGTRYAYPFMSYFDTKLQRECSIAAMSDGTRRCIPSTSLSPVSGYFGDASCTSRLALFTSGCAEAAPPDYIAEYVVPSGQGCLAKAAYTRIFHTGTEHSGSVYALSTTCVMITAPATWRLFGLGSELAPSEFVQFNETSEKR